MKPDGVPIFVAVLTLSVLLSSCQQSAAPVTVREKHEAAIRNSGSSAANTEHESGWGTIQGRIVLEGDMPELPPLVTKGDHKTKDAEVCASEGIPDDRLVVDRESGGIANVFVYIADVSRVHPQLRDTADRETLMDVINCRFRPHALVVRREKGVRVKMHDTIVHNVHHFPMRSKRFGEAIQPFVPEGQHFQFTKSEQVPIKVVCDLHTWMQAYWLVLDHPYAAITDAHGSFRISDLPVGTHDLVVWHERVGHMRKPSLRVRVIRGETTQVSEIVVPVRQLLGDK
jgi:hypothetical protein